MAPSGPITDRRAGDGPLRERRAAVAPLVAAAALAAALRLSGLRHGLPHLFSDLEPHVLMIAFDLGLADLDPGYFSKPGLLMYALSALFGLLRLWPFGLRAEHAFEPALVLAARAFCASLSLAAVPAAAWMVRQAGGGARAAALAALFQAVSLLDVQSAHYVVTDVPMALALSLGLGFACRVARMGGRRDVLLSAGCAALAAGAKYPGAALLPTLFVACLLRASRAGGWRAYRGELFRLFLPAVALAAALFALCNPFLLLRLPEASADLFYTLVAVYNRERALSEAHAPWQTYLFQVLGFGLGWPLLALALAGTAWSWRRREHAGIVLSFFGLSYFALISVPHSVYYRYALPLTAPLCVLAALGWERAWAWAGGDRRRRVAARVATAVLAVAAAAIPAARSARMAWLFTQPDSRELALAWAAEHIPAGSRVAQEGRFGVPLAFEEEQWPALRVFAADTYRYWQAVHLYRIAHSRAMRPRHRVQILLPNLELLTVVTAPEPQLALAGPSDLRRAGTDFVVLSNHFLSMLVPGSRLYLLEALKGLEPVAAFSPFRTLEGPGWRPSEPSWVEERLGENPWAAGLRRAAFTPWRDIWDRRGMGPVLWIYDVRGLGKGDIGKARPARR